MDGKIDLDELGSIGRKDDAKQFGQSRISQDMEAAEVQRRKKEARQKYGHGPRISVKRIRDRKLRTTLKILENKYQDASLKAKDAEILLENDAGFIEPETELERTYKVRQDDIQQSVSVETAKMGIDLKLAFGTYTLDYSRNGRSLLLAGRKGHVATIDWRAGQLGCEMQLEETVRAAKFLHNSQLFCVAQKKYLYIYDLAGVQLHCLKSHIEPLFVEYLPYHFLLTSIGNSGHIRYSDTSTGQNIIDIATKLGTPTSLCQNPYNAVLHCGHQNGTVTLWSPNSTSPLVKILAHRGPVQASAVDREGRYFITAGQDMKMSVWDIRTFREVNNYFLRKPGASLAISDRDLVAVGHGTQATVWRGLFSKARSDTSQEKVQSPYMKWGGDGKEVECVRWCPFEDVLGVGHSGGVTQAIIPGGGEPNYDALEANPFETPRQRQEAEVKGLLNKLRPEMISLNPDFVGNLDLASDEIRRREKDLDRKEEDPVLKLKNRGRGKNSSLRKHLRKKSTKNIIDERRERIEALRKETNKRTRKNPKKDPREELGPALARFVRPGI
ncbi:MAG: hypothetical protein LQ340_004517 [Diploschistes diacapsis]|nr:MAG: hypothetical protein LQ340_004517 [Diploschistes diacapsis]